MVTVRNEHRIPVLHQVCDRLSIGGIDRLVTEPLHGIHAVVIDLFQSRLPVHSVMLMRWIAAPVPWRVECFAYQQTFHRSVIDKDVMNLTVVVLSSPLLDADLIGAHQDGQATRLRRGGDDDSLEGGVRSHREIHTGRQV